VSNGLPPRRAVEGVESIGWFTFLRTGEVCEPTPVKCTLAPVARSKAKRFPASSPTTTLELGRFEGPVRWAITGDDRTIWAGSEEESRRRDQLSTGVSGRLAAELEDAGSAENDTANNPAAIKGRAILMRPS
jgi:hypothetical protein